MKKELVVYSEFISIFMVVITAEAMNVLTFVFLCIALVCSFYMEKHRAEFEQLADDFEKKFDKCFCDYLKVK